MMRVRCKPSTLMIHLATHLVPVSPARARQSIRDVKMMGLVFTTIGHDTTHLHCSASSARTQLVLPAATLISMHMWAMTQSISWTRQDSVARFHSCKPQA